MASIVKFPVGSTARRNPRDREAQRTGAAEILFFTGVFYQRMEQVSQDAMHGVDGWRALRNADEAVTG